MVSRRHEFLAGSKDVFPLAVGVASFMLPPRLQHAFRFLPTALLSALVCSQIFLLQGTTLSSNGPRLLAASLAALVAWRTRSALWTISVGMGTLWLLQWLTHLG